MEQPAKHCDLRLKPTLDWHNVSTGDLLFFSGTDTESQLIEIATHSAWSHVGTALKVAPSTIVSLCNFIKHMPPKWKEHAKHIVELSYEGDALHQSNGTHRAQTKGKEGILMDSYSKRLHIAELLTVLLVLRNNKHMTNAINDECQCEGMRNQNLTRCKSTSGSEAVTSGGVNARRKYPTSDQPASDNLLHNIPKLNLVNSVSSEDATDNRAIYLWESTTATDPAATCVISNRTDSGVKLTLLTARTMGYTQPVALRKLPARSFHQMKYESVGNNTSQSSQSPNACGKRKLKRNEASVNTKSSLYYRHILLSMFANIIVNLGKPYETNFNEMVQAWGYDQFLASTSSMALRSSNASSSSSISYSRLNGGGNSQNADSEDGGISDESVDCCTFRSLCCCLCWDCCPGFVDPYYRAPDEYQSIYCSELAMQGLYDHYVTQELMQYNTSDDTVGISNTSSLESPTSLISLLSPRSPSHTLKGRTPHMAESENTMSYLGTHNDDTSRTQDTEAFNKSVLIDHHQSQSSKHSKSNIAPEQFENTIFHDYKVMDTNSVEKRASVKYYTGGKDWKLRDLNLYYVLDRSDISVPVVPIYSIVSHHDNLMTHLSEQYAHCQSNSNPTRFKDAHSVQFVDDSEEAEYCAKFGRTAVTPKYLAAVDLCLPYMINNTETFTSII